MTLQKHPLDPLFMIDFSPSMLLFEQYVPLLLLLLPPSNNGYPSDNLELSCPLRLGQISFITLVQVFSTSGMHIFQPCRPQTPLALTV